MVDTLTASSKNRIPLDAGVSMAAGLALHDWWREEGESRVHLEPMARNRNTRAYAFHAHALIRGRKLPVIGVKQRILYARAKTTPENTEAAARWYCPQVREFALRYFLRITDFAGAQIYPRLGAERLPAFLQLMSWCPGQGLRAEGIRFEQLAYQLRGGRGGWFPRRDRTRIVDLRSIGELYDLVILQAQTFEQALTLGLSDRVRAPKLVIPLVEPAWVALRSDLITDQHDPSPGVLGAFGPGYVFLGTSGSKPASILPMSDWNSIIPAFEKASFEVLRTGEIIVNVVFVCRRPEITPMAGFNPATGQLNMLKAATGLLRPPPSFGQLLWQFLLQRVVDEYFTVTNTSQTWNMVSDWLREADVPEWVRAGTSLGDL